MSARASSRVITVQGRRIGVSEAGVGAPVILLHAFPFARNFWSETLDALQAAGLRGIALDLGGFGDATEPFPRAVTAMADDVGAALDVLGLDRASVVGLSMGGYVALALVARHRDRVARLVLADTRAGADPEAVKAGRNEAIAKVDAEGAEGLLDAMAAKLPASDAPEAVRQRIRARMAPQAGAIVAALIAMRDRPDRRGELASIDVPTLVVVGRTDAVTPPDEARDMAAAIPGARLTVIEGAGHLPNLEQPEAFSRALVGFLSGG